MVMSVWNKNIQIIFFLIVVWNVVPNKSKQKKKSSNYSAKRNGKRMNENKKPQEKESLCLTWRMTFGLSMFYVSVSFDISK